MRNWETEQVGHMVSGNFSQGEYDYWLERGEEALDAEPNRTKAATALMAELEDEITANLPETEGLYGSWLTGALSEVDWREVADLILDGVDEWGTRGAGLGFSRRKRSGGRSASASSRPSAG